jgi:ribosomal protein S18 acetylase RimI-like enzyme
LTNFNLREIQKPLHVTRKKEVTNFRRTSSLASQRSDSQPVAEQNPYTSTSSSLELFPLCRIRLVKTHRRSKQAQRRDSPAHKLANSEHYSKQKLVVTACQKAKMSVTATTNDNVLYRFAEAKDMPALSTFAKESFLRQFGHMYTPENGQAHVDESCSEAKFLSCITALPECILLAVEPVDLQTDDDAGTVEGSATTAATTTTTTTTTTATTPAATTAQASTPAGLKSDNSEVVVGYLRLCPMGLPLDSAVSPSIEIAQLYVAPQYHGQGVAAALMDRALALPMVKSVKAVYLGVYHENIRAQRFYRRYGFQEVGRYIYRVGPHEDNEIIMCRLQSSSN